MTRQERSAEADQGRWLDASQVEVRRPGEVGAQVTIHYPAMLSFGKGAMKEVNSLCKQLGFAGDSRPWGFLVQPDEQDPKRLLLKPLSESDPRGFPLRPPARGLTCHLNLRKLYAAYSMATYPRQVARVTIEVVQDPASKEPRLALDYGRVKVEQAKQLGPLSQRMQTSAQQRLQREVARASAKVMREQARQLKRNPSAVSSVEPATR